MKLAYASASGPVLTLAPANFRRSVRPSSSSAAAGGNVMFWEESSSFDVVRREVRTPREEHAGHEQRNGEDRATGDEDAVDRASLDGDHDGLGTSGPAGSDVVGLKGATFSGGNSVSVIVGSLATVDSCCLDRTKSTRCSTRAEGPRIEGLTDGQ